MTEAYGRQFVTQFGSEPLAAWAAGLSQYTDEQIQAGYTLAIQDNREFCPNLSALIGYITGSDNWEHRRIEAAERNRNAPILDRGDSPRLLPADIPERKSPGEHLADMRALFGGES